MRPQVVAFFRGAIVPCKALDLPVPSCPITRDPPTHTPRAWSPRSRRTTSCSRRSRPTGSSSCLSWSPSRCGEGPYPAECNLLPIYIPWGIITAAHDTLLHGRFIARVSFPLLVILKIKFHVITVAHSASSIHAIIFILGEESQSSTRGDLHRSASATSQSSVESSIKGLAHSRGRTAQAIHGALEGQGRAHMSIASSLWCRSNHL